MRTVVLDAAGLGTLAAVDALARLHRAARGAGVRLVVANAGEDLRLLVALVGLDGVLELRCDSAGQPVGQAEQREQAGVHEVRDPDDPAL